MRKKTMCLILCFFLIITTFLSSSVNASNEYTDTSVLFWIVHNSHPDLFYMLSSCSRYNPENDVIFAGYNNKGDFQAFYIVVVPNGKQYTIGDYKLTINSSGNFGIRGKNVSNFSYTDYLNYYMFRYAGDHWEPWGNLFNNRSDAGSRSYTSIDKSNFNLWDTNDNLVCASSPFNIPYIANSLEQLENLSVGELAICDNGFAPSKIVITLFDDTDDDVCFTACLMDYPDYVSRIDLDDPFSDLGYVIPWKEFPEFNFTQGHQYSLLLNHDENVPAITRKFLVNKSIKNTDIPLSRPEPTPSGTPVPTPTSDPMQGIIDSNKETQNILNDQTNAIKENTETNKNIFQKIGDILNLLNPFSENFFVYKLLELLFEGLKTFILPSSDFISNYFNELSSWFQERLGFLWTPFDIVNTFLERLNNNSLFVEPIIHIPNIVEPFTGQQLISATDYNLNSLLEKENFNTMYNVYLVIVDFIIYLGVLTLCYNTLVGVFRGSPDSITVVPSDDTNAYNRAVFNEKVTQYRNNIRKDKGGS